MIVYGREFNLRQAADMLPKLGTTVGRVWQRTFLDAIVAPGRFGRIMPEFRRVSDSILHPGMAGLETSSIPGNETIQMLPIDSGYGGMAPQDLYAVLRIVRWIKPKTIFEIGTFRGVTAMHLAANSDARIYTLDLPRDLAGDLQDYKVDDRDLLPSQEEIDRTTKRLSAYRNIQQLFGDSRTFDYTSYKKSMDLVIVDACHLYDYVMSDTKNAFDLLREAGAILWHDFPTSLDVTRALQAVAASKPIIHIEGTRLALYVRGFPIPQAPTSERSPAHNGHR